jgi:hypothetical protein
MGEMNRSVEDDWKVKPGIPNVSLQEMSFDELRRLPASQDLIDEYDRRNFQTRKHSGLKSPARKQVGGTHYNSHSMQPFDIIDEYDLNFYEGNALKYLLRWKDKNGVIDLEKAKHYIEILIQKERSPGGGDVPQEAPKGTV